MLRGRPVHGAAASHARTGVHTNNIKIGEQLSKLQAKCFFDVLCAPFGAFSALTLLVGRQQGHPVSTRGL